MNQHIYKIFILSLIIAINIFLIVFYFNDYQNKSFSVNFLDVGQGHSTLFKTENNIKILIDSGHGLEAKKAVSRHLNFFDKKLDILIATHFDLDHVGAFPYFTSNFKVSYFFDNGIEKDSGIFQLIDKKLAENNIVRKRLVTGNILQINENTKIEILFPPANINIQSFQDNASSLVLKITHRGSSILITGDSPEKIEKFLVKKYGDKLKADILLAGHHGSKTASSKIFLKTVDPEYMIFSVGKNNPYGHPNLEILERAEKLGIKILRTDEVGDIKFIYQNNNLLLKN